jgi:hypothetical protein
MPLDIRMNEKHTAEITDRHTGGPWRMPIENRVTPSLQKNLIGWCWNRRVVVVFVEILPRAWKWIISTAHI